MLLLVSIMYFTHSFTNSFTHSQMMVHFVVKYKKEMRGVTVVMVIKELVIT